MDPQFEARKRYYWAKNKAQSSNTPGSGNMSLDQTKHILVWAWSDIVPGGGGSINLTDGRVTAKASAMEVDTSAARF